MITFQCIVLEANRCLSDFDEILTLTFFIMQEGVVEDIALELFGETICKQLASANWKERLEGVEEITKVDTINLFLKDKSGVYRIFVKKQPYQLLNTY